VIAVDTNVLIYAHREELPQHATALKRLRTLAEAPVPWAIPVFCIGEFVRVVTHSRVFDPPSTLDAALAAIEGLLACPTLRILAPGERYPELLMRCVREAGARGNLVFDAQIVAVCREHGASGLLTLDRDFARFPGLKLYSLDDDLDR